MHTAALTPASRSWRRVKLRATVHFSVAEGAAMAAETLLRCVQEDQAKAVVFTEVTDGACAGYTLASTVRAA